MTNTPTEMEINSKLDALCEQFKQSLNNPASIARCEGYLRERKEENYVYVQDNRTYDYHYRSNN